MKGRYIRHTGRRLIITLLFFLFSFFSYAGSTRVQLKRKIQSTQQYIRQTRQQRQNILSHLKTTELKRSKLLLVVKSTSKKLSYQKLSLRQLKKKARQFNKTLAGQTQQLNQHLEQAYILYRQPSLKLLLDQKNSAAVDRIVTYQSYIANDLKNRMQVINQSLALIKKNEQRLTKQSSVVKNLNRRVAIQLRGLKQQQLRRRRIVAKLNANLRTQHQRLRVYKDNKRELDQTIKKLNRFSSPTKVNFAKLRGRLRWPVRGRVAALFGKRISRSQLRWVGTLIKAKAGRLVRAIAPGQVIYAKWLAGYGLLLIVNHGHGYLSLYGRNQNLFKKVGDRVKKGDIISTVGNTGGFKQSALYFAIRHKAQPLNPQRWCR